MLLRPPVQPAWTAQVIAHAKGTQALGEGSRGHGVHSCCSLLPSEQYHGIRGLPFVFKLAMILCFPRRHQNAPGFLAPGEFR